METKHTKGEWVVDEVYSHTYETTIKNKYGVRIAQTKSFTGNSFNDATHEEQLANAKLISAAPEMLEALNDLHKNLQEDSAIYRSSLKCKYINDLITKATK